ncbi:glycosyltransferase family 25 protein [Vibrio sp. Of7-15]|uniref:glycosyltransferase family 25 protein n=1 Tax=Vibrio sp. Of7-15 TaxID=2724879 RepID=UPI001EF36765|nr:glycosyltransferase family 25 protein [Vibrio sp. Of7-15]MCG7496794.1 glycosyltransferase family 25 protein [Vibrio sp. Of7-15]
MKIFVISLLRTQNRRTSIKEQLDNQNIKFEFFDAIDGHKEPNHPLFANYNYTKRLWFSNGRMPSKGELGCYASHYLLWKKCIKMNQPILIIEDDVRVSRSLKEFLIDIEKQTLKYGFLRLEPKTDRCNLYNVEKKQKYKIDFMDNNFGGTLSYSISPETARKLINGSRRWCMPVDNYIGSVYIHKVYSYLFSPSIVSNPHEFETTIQLGQEENAATYRKPTRELYSLYRRVRLKITNTIIIKKKIHE